MADKKTALVVDDSEIVRKIMSNLVSKLGFQVIEAVDGIDAIEKSLEHDVKLFVVDINMPGLDGISFVKRLRKTAKYKDTPVVIVSTESDEKDIKMAFEAGADLYFTKPVKIDNFLQKVENLIKIKGIE
ncbi:MAG: response regulator [Candidatus Calescibacterium sp.]|jgi:two-component system chemotaxis response regulator CheY|nr:response regulator [Candidatus Calescibacterium sp.]